MISEKDVQQMFQKYKNWGTCTATVALAPESGAGQANSGLTDDDSLDP